MNSLAIRGVKICDYYRFSFLTLCRPDWNGMAVLCTRTWARERRRTTTPNPSNPSNYGANPPQPSLTQENKEPTPPSPLLGREKTSLAPGETSEPIAGDIAPETYPLIPQKTLPGPEMSAWPYPSLSRNVP